MNNILSIYETFATNKGELTRILVQALDTPEKRIKLATRCKEATNEAIQNGRYNYVQELFAHTSKTVKPYLNKYKIS